MKQLYAFLFLMLTLQLVQAQDLRIYDYDWKLSELVIDGQSIPIPESNAEVQTIPLRFISDDGSGAPSFMTNVCNSGFGQPQFSTTENTFLLEQFFATLLLCEQPQNQSFESTYFSGLFFANIPGIFAYEISVTLDGSGRVMLVITAPDGSYARYFNSGLSSKSFDKNAFTISPNPASDYIVVDFKNQNIKNTTIEVYDNLGKLCLQKTIASQQPVNVQNLANGMYFLKVSNTVGTTIQKFIKM